MTTPAPTIDTLLNLVPDHPDRVLSALQAHTALASQKDAHGYTLVHAATSYNHIPLLTALIKDFGVDPNIRDEDGETALFNAETVQMARELLALGVGIWIKNDDGLTAAERLEDEDEAPLVATYLRGVLGDVGAEVAASVGQAQQRAAPDTAQENPTGGNADAVQRPPPLPSGVQINVGTMAQEEAGGEPDPEFRRRIEDLAAREDFQTEEGQRELRNLVQDAVSGLREEEGGRGSATRRRLG